MWLALCRLTPSDGGSKTTFQCLEDEASPGAQLVKNPPAMQETLVQSLGQEDPWRRGRLPTPVFWLGEFHGLYNPWGHKESDTTE